MRYVAAYALLVLAGNENLDADDILRLLPECGVTFDVDKARDVCNRFKG